MKHVIKSESTGFDRRSTRLNQYFFFIKKFLLKSFPIELTCLSISIKKSLAASVILRHWKRFLS
jgi:hypothetical protein